MRSSNEFSLLCN